MLIWKKIFSKLNSHTHCTAKYWIWNLGEVWLSSSLLVEHTANRPPLPLYQARDNTWFIAMHRFITPNSHITIQYFPNSITAYIWYINIVHSYKMTVQILQEKCVFYCNNLKGHLTHIAGTAMTRHVKQFTRDTQ